MRTNRHMGQEVIGLGGITVGEEEEVGQPAIGTKLVL